MSSTTGTLYVYGDSYSDTTNTNRKTNGPVWSEVVAKGWGLQLQSYATLGSRTCRASDINSPSIAGQVEQYRRSKTLEEQTQKDVHAFFIGITDITNSTKYEANNLVGCIVQQISNLRQSDSKAQVLLLGIPPLEYSPFYSNSSKVNQIKDRVNQYNSGLEDIVTDMTNDMDSISFIDNNFLFADILGNPAGYGIEDVDNAYWNQCQGRCDDSMDKYLWWDSIHLTGAGHKAIADTIITKNPFGYSIIKDASSSWNDDTSNIDTEGSFASSGDYMRYAPWFLLFCVFVLVIVMMRPKHSLHLVMRSVWKRRKAHAYTPVPV
ncbi:SGNH hydrolase-type esterase domain-containing protein [Halteromyces radiatus]|uniref:SGNH hydrolase-type esterase domain-containing protein n=1 Tax=Halteromyces radiatus TaxID=101107 RepID=UPI00221FC6FA|nr:SGNH hydrolase-type esterase domain-containing protein [Halteromyces radiatus]KAI8089526.1 SGNH hydrolase-type esterase domain-containing protein [Halteromyces radiatus]